MSAHDEIGRAVIAASRDRSPEWLAIQDACYETRFCSCNYEAGPCGDCRKVFARRAAYLTTVGR